MHMHPAAIIERERGTVREISVDPKYQFSFTETEKNQLIALLKVEEN